jgi:hypothetical protein
MTPKLTPSNKQRVTVFLDPALVKRAKIRGALEELTMSELVEKALEVYAPRIEKNSPKNIHLQFTSDPLIVTVVPNKQLTATDFVAKRTKKFTVPR